MPSEPAPKDSLASPGLDADQLEAMTDRLVQQAREIRAGAEGGRYAALDTAQGIVALLKDPAEQWIDTQQAVALAMAVRMFQHWKAFDAIPTAVGRSISYAELAEKTGVQLSLLRRIAWMMVSSGVLKQEGADMVSHTPRSLNYLESTHGSDYHKTFYNLAFRAYGVLPQYFDSHGNHEPESQTHIPVTWAQGTPELTFWGHLERHPDQIGSFMHAIAPAAARMPVTGVYDFSWLADAARRDPDGTRVLFVDVGGGAGRCIAAIHAENPDIPPGRFLLQDQPHVVAQVAADTPEGLKGVQLEALDFHKESPRRGALVYHLRLIMHDYSDTLATAILRRVVDAMDDDSRLLIAEDVATNPPHFMTAMMDMLMLTLAGKERTMEDFERITAAAGLRISSVARSRDLPYVVIECMKS